jgi:uncharacterized protein YukE
MPFTPPKQVAGPAVPEPLSAQIRSSYQKLLAATAELNSASDRFSKLVGEIDATLKPLNIGITSWVQMGPGRRDDGRQYSTFYDSVGFSKIDGKWCIALATLEKFDDDRPEEEQDWTIWAFAEGPRSLRLKAIQYLPTLLDALAKKAIGETENIAERTQDLQEIVSALRIGGKK